MTQRAAIYLSPAIKRALDLVPSESISGRLTTVCERYMRLVDAILAQTQFKPGELTAIRKVLGYLPQLGDDWAMTHVGELARFEAAIRIAIIEMIDREQAQTQFKREEGGAK